MLIAVGFWFLFDVLSITTGMYALALLKPMPANPLAIYPELGGQVLPPGLRAVFLCGMLGTITSAMVGYTLVSGATIGREVVGRLAELSAAATKFWTRVGFALAGVVAIALALSVESVVDLWYAWGGCVIGALLIPVLVAYRGGLKLSPAAVAISMIVSFSASLTWLLSSTRTKNTLQEVAFLKIRDRWQIAFPPIPDSVQHGASDTFRFSLGTLLPGLLISILVLAVGTMLDRLRKQSGTPSIIDPGRGK